MVPVAAAASVALAVGLGLGITLDRDSPDQRIALGDTPHGSALQIALETIPSGNALDDQIIPMLSFRDRAGRFCREFEVVGELVDELEIGIACRDAPGTWHVEIVVTAPIIAPIENGYAPASGPGADALEAMLDALGASTPISPTREAELILDAWRDGDP